VSHSTIDTPSLGDALNRYGPTAAREARAKGERPASRTIDIHAHVAIPEAARLAGPHIDRANAPLLRFSSALTREVSAQQEADRRVAITDPDDRVAVLDAQRIDLQVVAPPPGQCYYSVSPEIGAEAARLVNDGLVAFVERHPDRFLALGTAPMQDTAAAVAELRRCMSLPGMRGVQILTNVEGRELSDPAFEPFWREAEALGALVMLHPNAFTHGERLGDHYFSNLIGNPLDTTIALHRLIFDGVLARMPGLKILAVHGGGFLPAYSGRIDHGWGARRDSHAGLPRPPSAYLREIWIDSVVFTTHQLEYLARTHGAERVVMGSDYPFDMADYDPVEHVMGADLSDAEKAAIAGLNAARLLGLDP
jgi:aminocarboxymuconate-semialdehyde decarboxylase